MAGYAIKGFLMAQVVKPVLLMPGADGPRDPA
jgi:hypothetical protein